MTTETRRKFLIDTAFFVIVGILIYLAFTFLSIYMLPFVIGIIASFLVQKPVKTICKKIHISKGPITVLMVVFTYLLIIGVIALLSYLIYKWLSDLSVSMPDIMDDVTAAFNDINTSFSNMLKSFPPQAADFINSLPEKLLGGLSAALTNFLSTITSNIATGLPNFIISVVVTVVASCYIASDYDSIIHFARRNIPSKAWSLILDIKDIFTKNILKMLKGYLLLMFITFIELNIGLMIIGQKNSVLLAAIICIVDILPVLGTGTVVIPWALFELLLSNFWRALGLIIMYIVITVVRNFFEPKIIGKQVGLHPLITLLSMFVGLRLVGFLGLFLFPITMIVLSNLYKKGRIHFCLSSKIESNISSPQDDILENIE